MNCISAISPTCLELFRPRDRPSPSPDRRLINSLLKNSRRVERAPPPAALEVVLGFDRVERTLLSAAFDVVFDLGLDFVPGGKHNRGRAALQRRVKHPKPNRAAAPAEEEEEITRSGRARLQPCRPSPRLSPRLQPLRSASPAPTNKNGASPKGPAPHLFTLYYQNIKPKGVNPPHTTTLYSTQNEQLTKKSSTQGS